jgi:hypothetical protein
MNINVSGAFTLGFNGASPGAQHNGPMPSLAEDMTWIKGSHQVGFGGSIYQQRLNYWSGGNTVGKASFDGTKSGLSLGDFLLGLPVTFNQGTNYGFYTRQFYDSLYIQDNWKINSRLTLNYGLRWEPYLSYYNDRGENVHFDPGLFARNVHSTLFVNAPAGLVFQGDPQYTSGKYFNGPSWSKFFPRIGLAWDPQGNGRMTIRAAYGMYGDRAMMLAGTNGYMAPPFGYNLSLSGVNVLNPWANFPGGNPMAGELSAQGTGIYPHDLPFFPSGTYTTSPLSNFKPVYMNQWNLSIQRQVGKDWLLSANYVGNTTIHMISGENENYAVFLGTGPCTLQTASGPVSYSSCSTTANQQSRLVYSLLNPAQGQYYAGIGTVDDGGTAGYEGMYLSVQKRLSRGLAFQANYTWSHCISDVYNQTPGSGGVSVPGNRRQWRSNCIGIDLRHLFVLNLVATTPRYSHRALRIAASGWQIAPILLIKSAQEFSVFNGSDRALSTVANQTPNFVNLNPYSDAQNVNHWINASAFGLPAPGTYGNLGYNNLKGPGVFQLNLALSRNFAVWERSYVQLRAEAFNLPNHLNPFAPGGPNSSQGMGGAFVNLNTSNFGQITNDISGNNGLQSGDYRVIQLAMKFVF